MRVIIVARKPLSEGSVAANVLKWGCGGLNIDAARVKVVGETISTPYGDPTKRTGVVGQDLGFSRASVEQMHEAQRLSVERANALGRFPANLILSHLPGCECRGVRQVKGSNAHFANTTLGSTISRDVLSEYKRVHKGWVGHADENGQEAVPDWHCAPGCPVQALDAQSGQSRSASGAVTRVRAKTTGWKERGGMFTPGRTWTAEGLGDKGGASRFFKQVRAVSDETEVRP